MLRRRCVVGWTECCANAGCRIGCLCPYARDLRSQSCPPVRIRVIQGSCHVTARRRINKSLFAMPLVLKSFIDVALPITLGASAVWKLCVCPKTSEGSSCDVVLRFDSIGTEICAPNVLIRIDRIQSSWWGRDFPLGCFVVGMWPLIR